MTGQIVGVNSWPDGATWVFQGTVAEDATAGTHVSSLTITPGAGNEFTLLYARFKAGAGAANLFSVIIDDGTNTLADLVQPNFSLSSSQVVSLPFTGVVAGQKEMNVVSPIIISGAMRLIMSVSTATISLTHTFAVVCRIKGAMPTATLADTVGTPTLTTNTNAVFG